MASAAVRRASRVAHVPLSSLPSFPPKDALATSSNHAAFDSTSWSSTLRPPPQAFSALAHRIGLGNSVPISDLQQACTHSSVLPLHALHAKRGTPAPASNDNLAAMGNSLLGLFAAEHISASYPHLPTRVLKAAVSAYVGPLTCATVAKEMGAAPLLRWHRTPPTPLRPAILHSDALSSVPRALTALVYQHRSLPSARTFAHSFFLSRSVDLRPMLKFRDPKLNLCETVAKFGRERPISRLLKETGRFSNSPVFVVGVYSGEDKLGEGFGSSLKMAEYRAAEDALHRLYLTRTPSHELQLPTSTFAEGDIFTQGPEADAPYVAGELGTTEVLTGSAGRTSSVLPKRPTYAEEIEQDES
ncbi:ribonuclease III domain-containing protein [Amylostereum chailletii]|nr:ribonuclease III domain-containing protein [Amylostereum chailletii]